jgi:FlaA1/EpsC-like NDP-sugar epimerase
MPIPESDRYQRFLAHASEEGATSPFAGAAAGRRVLVTGAGGSIGSDLAAALAAAGPAQLVLLDASEYNLFRIGERVKAPHAALLGSVADAGLLDRLFDRYRPEMVYHAAAFKHVALLERNPLAAVGNNVLGTCTLARAALAHQAAALVLVSTDKAVKPRSIMGASKRVAELTLATLATAACRMNAVRLGNVIGSTGSAIPLFEEQIAARRPVTVTDPEATRYFLSPGEAVAAILAAGAATCTGKILLPELGAPERIAGIAQFLIRAAGNGSAREIPIRVTGLRPGEKLHEDLIGPTEVREGRCGPLAVLATRHPTREELDRLMDELTRTLAAGDLDATVRTIRTAVPEYEPSAAIEAAR